MSEHDTTSPPRRVFLAATGGGLAIGGASAIAQGPASPTDDRTGGPVELMPMISATEKQPAAIPTLSPREKRLGFAAVRQGRQSLGGSGSVRGRPWSGPGAGSPRRATRCVVRTTDRASRYDAMNPATGENPRRSKKFVLRFADMKTKVSPAQTPN